jgi:hypothetical protein
MMFENHARTVPHYFATHNWVRYHFGKASICSNLECAGRSTTFEWSNNSGLYKRDIEDWQQLCRSCHRLKDKGVRCKYGHKFTEENTYRRPDNGTKRCKICRDSYTKQFLKNGRLQDARTI